MSAKEIVKLKYPFEFAGKKIDSIELRRAKYRDIKIIQTLEEKEILNTMLVNLSEMPQEIIDEIDAFDIAAIEKVITGFLGVAAT